MAGDGILASLHDAKKARISRHEHFWRDPKILWPSHEGLRRYHREGHSFKILVFRQGNSELFQARLRLVEVLRLHLNSARNTSQCDVD